MTKTINTGSYETTATGEVRVFNVHGSLIAQLPSKEHASLEAISAIIKAFELGRMTGHIETIAMQNMAALQKTRITSVH